MFNLPDWLTGLAAGLATLVIGGLIIYVASMGYPHGIP